MKLVIICVESDSKARTDNVYIDKAIKYRYKIDNDIKIMYLNLNGKGNYKANKVKSEIKRLSKSNSVHSAVVIYCLDTDNYWADNSINQLNQEIADYCQVNNYELVWFCKDVEDVFLHESIPATSKLREATKFNKGRGLGKATISALSCANVAREKK